jgi:membrane protein DedA with SNARE-associated domain
MISLVESISNLIISLISSFGYAGIFFAMALESACIPFPSEIIMPFSGFVVSEGKMGLLEITLVGALGNLLGSVVAYQVGLRGGRPFLDKNGKYLLLSKKKLDLAEDWFSKYGDWAVLLSRILPVMRTYISLPAGIARMNFGKFSFYTFVGSLPWCFALGYIGVLLGPKWDSLKGWFHILDAIIIISIICIILYMIFRYKKNKGPADKDFSNIES